MQVKVNVKVNVNVKMKVKVCANADVNVNVKVKAKHKIRAPQHKAHPNTIKYLCTRSHPARVCEFCACVCLGVLVCVLV